MQVYAMQTLYELSAWIDGILIMACPCIYVQNLNTAVEYFVVCLILNYYPNIP